MTYSEASSRQKKVEIIFLRTKFSQISMLCTEIRWIISRLWIERHYSRRSLNRTQKEQPIQNQLNQLFNKQIKNDNQPANILHSPNVNDIWKKRV